jgi:hypothetical protein
MAGREEYDRYAAELAQRFEDWVGWAITHWPRENYPLLSSDFEASRRELSQILGPKLGDPDQAASETGPEPKNSPHDQHEQYRDTKPMPWP